MGDPLALLGRDPLAYVGSPDPLSVLSKAASAAGPGTPPPDGRWPAWTVDTALATLAAAGLVRQMGRLFSLAALSALVAAFIAWARTHITPGAANAVEQTAAWLTTQQNAVPAITTAIRPPLEQLWPQAYLAGDRSAQAVIEHGDARHAAQITVDWGRWRPGDRHAALRMLQPGAMDRFLRDDHSVLGGIARTRVQRIAQILADGLLHGDAPATIARTLRREVVDDRTWAMTVAWTETNRATSQAALDRYAQGGAPAKEWMTALDQRVCPVCKKNEEAGPIPLFEAFPSGDQTPPGHPRCRCALLPGIMSA